MVLNIREEEDSFRRDPNEDTSHPGRSPTNPETSRPRSSTNSYPFRINGDHHHNSSVKEENGKRDTLTDAPLDFSVKRKEDLEPSDNRQECNGNENGNEPMSPCDSEVGSSSSPIYRKPSPIPLAKTIKTEEKNGHLNGHKEKLSDSKPVFPGFLPAGMGIPQSPGMLLPPYFNPSLMSGMGMMGAMPSLVADQKVTGTLDQQNSSKSNRPFKSYPKDHVALPMGYFGVPNMAALPAIDANTAQAMSQNSEEMYKYYRDYVMKLQQQQRNSKNNHNNLHHQQQQQHSNSTMHIEDISDTESIKEHHPHSHEEDRSPTIAPQSPPCLPSQSSQSPPYHQITTSQDQSRPVNGTPTSTGTDVGNASSRKRSRLPENQKDASYWERRRKNNEAAKRSRDARRAKEDEIAIRAAFLEQENLKLRVEVAALKTETAKLRCMLYNS